MSMGPGISLIRICSNYLSIRVSALTALTHHVLVHHLHELLLKELLVLHGLHLSRAITLCALSTPSQIRLAYIFKAESGVV